MISLILVYRDTEEGNNMWSEKTELKSGSTELSLPGKVEAGWEGPLGLVVGEPGTLLVSSECWNKLCIK